MNTADKSLAQLDLALRRRFDFVEMLPDTQLLNQALVFGQSVGQILGIINKRIQALLSREHVIGHAYFMPLLDKEDEDERHELAKQIFKNKIIPLLQEYFFDDWDSIRKVLGHNSGLLIVREKPFEGLNHKPVYHLDFDALDKPEFYEGMMTAYEDK